MTKKELKEAMKEEYEWLKDRKRELKEDLKSVTKAIKEYESKK